MPTTLKLYTLGGITIKHETPQPKSDISRKAEALLVYLARTRRVQHREYIAEFLWPNQTQEKASTSLRVALTHLRKRFAAYLEINRQTISFNHLGSWLDAHELDSAVKTAAQIVREHGYLEISNIESLENALTLYQGDFLFGFYIPQAELFDEWLVQEREWLRQRTIEGIQYLISSYERHGLFMEGVRWARQYVQLDSLNEIAHRHLMSLLAYSGDRRAAFEQYKDCVRLLQTEIGEEPAPETSALYQQIRAGNLVPLSRSHRIIHQQLPAATFPFVGRLSELNTLSDLLSQPECRLISIVGGGGMGKTRLAVRAAQEYQHFFTDGVCFVPLAMLERSQFLSTTILDALQLTYGGRSDPYSQMLQYLADKDILLIIDNFEHLLDSSQLITDILDHAPAVKILVTTREQLNLQEEWLVYLSGMGCPKQADVLEPEAFPAIQLFLQSARRILPDFQFASAPQAIIQICQLVEGMPLAIELAAGWLRVLSPTEIVTQIETSLDFLASSLRNVPERHRSIRAVFEHTWEPLSPHEQKVLMHLSIFQGGFTLKAAQVVAKASFPVLRGLVEKSLIRTEPSGRYGMHELLRQFVTEKLIESKEVEQIKNLHLAYYIHYAEEAERQLHSSQRLMGLQAFIIETDNLRQALDWSEQANVSPDQVLLLVSAMYAFWQARGDMQEASIRMQAVIKRPDIDQHSFNYARVLYGLAGIAWWTGDYGNSLKSISEAIFLFERHQQQQQWANALRNRGLVYMATSNYEAAIRDFEEALPILQNLPEHWGAMLSLVGIRHILCTKPELQSNLKPDDLTQIEHDLAITWHGNALPLGNLHALLRQDKNASAILFTAGTNTSTIRWDKSKRIMAAAFYELSKIALNKANYERTEAYLKDSIVIFYECHDLIGVIRCLRQMVLFTMSMNLLEASARMMAMETLLCQQHTIYLPNEHYDEIKNTLKTKFNITLKPDLSLYEIVVEVVDQFWSYNAI